MKMKLRLAWGHLDLKDAALQALCRRRHAENRQSMFVPPTSGLLILCSTAQDPLVHHGRHFGRAVHAFCNVQTLILNGLITLGEGEDEQEMTAA
jgi:hypothetical protein